jgi:hypothetical protein
MSRGRRQRFELDIHDAGLLGTAASGDERAISPDKPPRAVEDFERRHEPGAVADGPREVCPTAIWVDHPNESRVVRRASESNVLDIPAASAEQRASIGKIPIGDRKPPLAGSERARRSGHRPRNTTRQDSGAIRKASS